MTRKDYVMLAAALGEVQIRLRANNVNDKIVTGTLEMVALVIANRLAADNPRFEVDRFLRDCGVVR